MQDALKAAIAEAESLAKESKQARVAAEELIKKSQAAWEQVLLSCHPDLGHTPRRVCKYSFQGIARWRLQSASAEDVRCHLAVLCCR